VRDQNEYFDVVENEKVPKDMLDLAIHIVETKKGKFEPEKFEDQYEDALKDLIKKKQKGEKIERPTERAPSNVVNLMDALRQSVKADREGGKQKTTRPQAKKGKKRIEGQREMLLPITGKKGKEIAKPAARTATRRKAG
jgi:DNA end-binding protein Ku